VRIVSAVIITGLLGPTAAGQAPARPPVIDVHVHSTNTSPQQALERMKSLNIRFLVVSSLTSDMPQWAGALDVAQFLPGLVFPCADGRAPITGRPCFNSGTELPDVAWLTGELKAGRIKAFSELSPQYLGLSPADPRMEPYWQLAEQFDLPVGIHMGPGPPGIAYDASRVPFKSPAFRMAMSDPLLLEEVLLRHKRLRLFVMHAGWPQLERMLALMYAHPNVYVDVAALQSLAIMPRAAYYRHLRGLVDAGFGKRIMFGSDFPDQAGPGIDAILAADFLSAEQRADILCNNAARFLRLDSSLCGA
jgi:Amidohydrolase